MHVISDPLHLATTPVSDLQSFSRQRHLLRVKCLTSRLECSLLMLPSHQILEQWPFLTAHKDGNAGIGLSPGLKVTIFEMMAPSTRRFCALKWKLLYSWCRKHNSDAIHWPAGLVLEFLKELFCHFSAMFAFLFGTICGFRRAHYSWFELLGLSP